MEKRILERHIEHAGRCRERRLREGIVVVGYSSPKDEEDHQGLVLQFHGCFWHGRPRCYRINRDVALSTGDSMDDRFEKTLVVSRKIKESNYELIEKWECDFQKEVSQNEELRHFIQESTDDEKQKPLDPQDAFFGGRTGNTVKVYDWQEQKKIKYVDVCSFYPFICNRGKYPIGHPKIYVGWEECRRIMGIKNDLFQVNGLKKLIPSLITGKNHGKLIFPLCRTCCEQMTQEDCPHQDQNERVLRGTWVSEEIKEALKLGYTIQRVYEIWQYQMTQYNQNEHKGGIFAEYINEVFAQKTMASGFLPGYLSEKDKDEYVKELEIKVAISLNKDAIQHNAGLRSVAKICLNSLWGKFGQRENMTQTEVITKPERLTELLTNPEIDVNGILPVNDEILYANWCYSSEALLSSPMTSVVIASFTTAQARLELFKYLHTLGPRALYHDTDSVFYISREASCEHDLPTGVALGELTNELASNESGTYITSFLSGGPKFYKYKFKKSDGVEEYGCKVKGIRLNYSDDK